MWHKLRRRLLCFTGLHAWQLIIPRGKTVPYYRCPDCRTKIPAYYDV